MIEYYPFSQFFISQGHPDFFDLPWNIPLKDWQEKCSRFIEIEKGISRHIVVFVCYRDNIYVIKELPKFIGEREYRTLKTIEKLRCPCVKPIGFGEFRDEDRSVLITQFLESSLPYRTLFIQPGLDRYQDRLLDAMAILLVQLHLKGIFWGDCSLSNTLFRRDVGELQAYFVDAETSKVYPSLSEGQREHDLMIMEENVSGELMDLSNMAPLPKSLNIYTVASKLRGRYEHLWNLLTEDEVINVNERYRIYERIKRINDLGFTVDEIKFVPTEDKKKLVVRPFVSERGYNTRQLHSLTGIAAAERQAQLILNEIYEIKASLFEFEKIDLPLSSVAFKWMNEIYKPTLERLGLEHNSKKGPEIYCEVLEHKWFLSEDQKKDVGLKRALEDYIKKIYNKRKNHL
ncbi:MAG: DUF4032 domain-containing protein [Candidatus Hodarchaeales archaeon]